MVKFVQIRNLRISSHGRLVCDNLLGSNTPQISICGVAKFYLAVFCWTIRSNENGTVLERQFLLRGLARRRREGRRTSLT